MEDARETTQDDRLIPTTPLFDRLCSDDPRVNLRNSKAAMVSMIIESLSPCIGRLVHGSLVYPERYHQRNPTTDLHHFFRQVFQRCPKRLGNDPQLKRVFFEEVKDGEGVHFHFIMETPREMEMSKFTDLCETRWENIATRDRRHKKQKKRLERASRCSRSQPKTFLIKKEMPRVGRIASPLENELEVLLSAHPDFQWIAEVRSPEYVVERLKHAPQRIASQKAIDSEVFSGHGLQRLAQVTKIETLEELTKYSLKWMTSTDPRFSSAMMTGGSEVTIRGHCAKLVRL